MTPNPKPENQTPLVTLQYNDVNQKFVWYDVNPPDGPVTYLLTLNSDIAGHEISLQLPLKGVSECDFKLIRTRDQFGTFHAGSKVDAQITCTNGTITWKSAILKDIVIPRPATSPALPVGSPTNAVAQPVHKWKWLESATNMLQRMWTPGLKAAVIPAPAPVATKVAAPVRKRKLLKACSRLAQRKLRHARAWRLKIKSPSWLPKLPSKADWKAWWSKWHPAKPKVTATPPPTPVVTTVIAPVRKRKLLKACSRLARRKLRHAWKHYWKNRKQKVLVPPPVVQKKSTKRRSFDWKKITAALAKLFVVRRKRQQLKVTRKMRKRDWAYRTLQYFCQRWAFVLLILLMILVIMPKKQAKIVQAVVPPNPVAATNAAQATAVQPVPATVPTVVTQQVIVQVPTIVTQVQTIYVAAAMPPPTVQPPPPKAVKAFPRDYVPDNNNGKGEEIVLRGVGSQKATLKIAPGKYNKYFLPSGWDIVHTDVRNESSNAEDFEYEINGKPALKEDSLVDENIRSYGFLNQASTTLVVTLIFEKTPEKLGFVRRVFFGHRKA